ncbi:head-tail connector protein [Plesiomonas shigelloides]|uniref:head-tail connector protein n=1 Tax=Plesiomonas shigelloides TaxID=703 RepID=UPI00387F270F
MLDLALVKQQCRIEPDFLEDDNLLNLYIRAAVRFVEGQTDRKLYASDTEEGFAHDEDALLLDADIYAAMLQMIGYWYANREADPVSYQSIEELLRPYRAHGL